MTGVGSRLLMFVALVLLAACGAEVKQPAPTASQTGPIKATPAPTTQPPTPQTPAPGPAPATAPPASAPPPPAVVSPTAPAAQEAQPKAATDAPQHLVVSVGRANMREKSDSKSRIIQVLTKGTKLVVVSKGNQWYRVRTRGGAEGWVAESVVTPARPD